MKSMFSAMIVLSVVLLPAVSSSELPSGEEVAKNINARDEGVAVSRNVLMEMTDKRGKTRTRKTRGFRKYYGDEKRTVIFYLSPKNVKDTAFLTYDYPEVQRDDDQWLYIPAARKVRRISASDRGDYFLGTDFTFEDIKLESKVSLDDYQRSTLREEVLDGLKTYVVEAIPVSKAVAKELGYSKVLQWVDPEIWMTRKAEFYDVRGKLLKTTYTKDIKQVQGIWTAHLLEVNNHKTRHKTRFTFSDVYYDASINDGFFTERALRRGL